MHVDSDKINNPTLLLNPLSTALSLRAMASLVQSSQSLDPSSSLRRNYKHAHQPISSSSSLSFRWINSSRRRRIVAMASSSKGKYLREDYLVVCNIVHISLSRLRYFGLFIFVGWCSIWVSIFAEEGDG